MTYSLDYDLPDWVHAKQPPEGYSSRMYCVEPGCEYGFKEDDGYVWNRIKCSYWFGDWIEEQDASMWCAYSGRHRAIYIVREDLMMFIKMKWL